MISTETRSSKPYALPVQCVSYTGITVAQVRRILDGVITAMTGRGMKAVGMLSLQIFVNANSV